MLLQWNIFLTAFTSVVTQQIHQPHIVFIVADDLGWDDVSFHGSDQILTPNIDTLAYHGVALHQYYTDCDGTASRSALFTGKYAMRMGTQGASIRPSEDRGIPVKERLLSNYLQELGYETHMVGKWGVGKSRPHYLPSNRGFKGFYGFLGDSVDYFTYNAIEKCDASTFYGLDFFHNLEAIEHQSGHLTQVLTEKAVEVIRNHNASVPLYLCLSHAAPHIGGALSELQPSVDSISENDHIAHPLRRLYAGLVTSLDRSVGHVVASLAEKEMLNNTLIVFVSDNGAPTIGWSQNYGSNFPFRGIKSTPWEGGVRSIAVAWHAQMSPSIFEGLFHVTDWLPTLVTAAGGYIKEQIDGIDQWSNIIGNSTEKNKRNEILLSIDESKGWVALREGDFKIIIGDVSREFSSYYGNDLKQLKGDSIFYDDFLLDCETAHVFKETLQIILDVQKATITRDDFNISQIYHESKRDACVPTKAKGCLFNISADPLETQDLWHSSPEIVRHLTLRVRTLWTEVKPRGQPLCDVRADPALRDYVWFPWIDDEEFKLETYMMVPAFPLHVSVGEIQYLVDMNFNAFKNKVNSYIKVMGETLVKSVKGLFSL